jgi:SNF2 family DNA or RNA helicase
MTTYQFKTDPKPHQLACFRRFKEAVAAAFFLDYGCGKSKTTIDNTAYLFEAGRIGGLLVAAPKGLYMNWVGEINKHLPDRIERKIGWYDASSKKASKDSLKALYAPGTAIRVLLMNIESIADGGYETCEEFLEKFPSLMAMDESTTIKTPTAQRTKASIKLGHLAKYRRILTGDPYANSPIDVWAQFAFLDVNLLGYPSFVAFRRRFAKLAPVPGAPRWITRVVGYQNLDELKRLVAPHAFFASKDLLGLIPKKYLEPLEIPMTKAQRQAYEEMKTFSMTEIGRQMTIDFEPQEEPELTFEDLMALTAARPVEQVELPVAKAKIVLTQLLRLQQIACGFVKTEDGKEVDLTNGYNPRIWGMVEDIQAQDASRYLRGLPPTKVIIWCPFRYSAREILAALTKTFGESSIVQYTGDTSSEDRTKAIQRFQEEPATRFFLGSQSTGGRGITITAADYVIYFANVFDNELRGNSEDRPHRIGLDHEVSYRDIICAPVDEKVYKALSAKKSVSDLLRDGTWRELFS